MNNSSSTTVRISAATHQKLKKLAARQGVTITAILDAAVERYRRKAIVDAANQQYAALRADPEAWAEYQREQAAWDATLLDGLPKEDNRG